MVVVDLQEEVDNLVAVDLWSSLALVDNQQVVNENKFYYYSPYQDIQEEEDMLCILVVVMSAHIFMWPHCIMYHAKMITLIPATSLLTFWQLPLHRVHQ